ncbi:MAG: hypothetical protein GX682_04695 [Clostridiaceae bacterium]|nr:hypothetical protein [Clostridiaceae bacterium]
MENASKALIMAGSVLIAIVVISLLVIFFGNLRGLQNTTQSVEQVEQATEFNKQYDAYARDVYGSELLSIANKINDYNERIAENDQYTQITLAVTIQNDIDNEYFKKGTYTTNSLIQKVENLEDKINSIGSQKIISSANKKVSRKVSKLATMRTADIEALGFTTTQYQELVSQYNSYKTLLTEIKSKTFKFVNFDYEKYTGRITKMNYKY